MAIDLDPSAGTVGVDLGKPSSLNNMSIFTISVWIKPGGWGQSSYGRVVDKKSSSSGWSFYLNDGTSTETVTFKRERSTQDTIVTPVNYSIDLDKWQHLAVAHKSTDTNVYINSVEPSYAVEQVGSGTNVTDDHLDLQIGNSVSYARGFDGLIEDFRIYDKFLSAGEIGFIYMAQGRDAIWQNRLVQLPLTQWAPGVTIGTGADAVKDITNNKLHGTSLYASTAGAAGVIL
jgi:hypothetical protein